MSPILGNWPIIEMDLWDQAFVDAELPGFIHIRPIESEFHFGHVHGHMDCEFTLRNGRPTVAWSWS